MSDQAALAGESLGKLNDKIAKQRQKIDDVNVAMTTLRINAAAAGKTLEDYIKYGTVDNPNAGKQDAAAVVGSAKTAGIPVAKTGTQVSYNPGTGVTVTQSKKDVGSQALDIINTTNDAVAKGLSAKGIQMGSGDIIINGKKMDVSKSVDANGNSLKAISYAVSTTGAMAKTVGEGALSAAGVQGRGKGTMFVDKAGTKWKIVGGGMYGNYNVEKAGFGTMKLDPKIPTIVGDRGPEMAFGGMVIPNMSKIPFSSPRYDVGQAAKMFEPMRDTKSGGSVINLTQNIYPSDGMNTDAFVRQVVSMTKQAIGQDTKVNAKMVGNSMNVSIKK